MYIQDGKREKQVLTTAAKNSNFDSKLCAVYYLGRVFKLKFMFSHYEANGVRFLIYLYRTEWVVFLNGYKIVAVYIGIKQNNIIL